MRVSPALSTPLRLPTLQQPLRGTIRTGASSGAGEIGPGADGMAIPRYSYATVTRPSDEDQWRDRSVQSTGETERGGAPSDQLPHVPEGPGEATASASASLGTRFLTTSSTSPEPPAANSGTRPTEVASSSTWDPWAQAAASSDRTPEPPVTAPAQPWWQDSPAWSSSWNWSGGYGKGDYSDPPAWPGWSYRRQWTAAVKRWDKTTDVPLWKRADKVMRSLGWELQASFEHLTESQLSSNKYLEHILSILELKAGVREDDERRQAFKTIMYDGGRKKDETLGQYAMRRIRDYNQAANHGIQIPDEFKASLLREGANLSEQSQQNLTTLIQGREGDVDFVATSLARLDVRSDRLTGFVQPQADTSSSFLTTEVDGSNEPEDDDEASDGDLLEEMPDQFFAELEDLDMDEEQIGWVLATLEGRGFPRKRSWKENKKFKAEARKDRGSFVKSSGGHHEAPRGQFGGAPGHRPSHRPRQDQRRGRMSVDELKKITQCRICHKRGHWSAECPTQKQGSHDVGAKVSGFCYLGNEIDYGPSAFSYATGLPESSEGAPEPRVSPSSWTFLSVPSAMAILDIGATQDIIGTRALSILEDELGKCGLQVVEVAPPSTSPTGIGGAAKVVRAVLAPISPGGIPGVVHFIVVQENIPPLLSVGFLEHVGAAIDLISNEIHLRTIGVHMKMRQLPSGHRAIPLVQWDGRHFPVPPPARLSHGLTEDAFMKKDRSEASSRYSKSSGRFTTAHQGSVVGVSFAEQDHVICYEGPSEPASESLTAPQSWPDQLRFFHDVNLGSATASMGNQLAATAPKFEGPARDHGTTTSLGGLDGSCRDSASMEGPHRPGLLCVRDSPPGLPPPGDRRDGAEERLLGPQGLPDPQQSGAREVPAPRRASSSGEPVRDVDGLPPLLRPPELHLQESSATRARANTRGIEQFILDRTSGSSTGHSDYIDLPQDTAHQDVRASRGDRASPSESDPSGFGCGIPGSRSLYAGSRPRTEPDADDAGSGGLLHRPNRVPRGGSSPCYGSGGELRPELTHVGGREPGRRVAAELGRGASRERLLPSSVQRHESERRGPPMTSWPRWMTISAMSLASSMMSWDQLTPKLQSQLAALGGDEDCSAVFWEPASGPKEPPGRPTLPWTWTSSTATSSEGLSEVFWHRQEHQDGRLLSQGPGLPPPRHGRKDSPEEHSQTVIYWHRPKKFRLLDECRDREASPCGFDLNGDPSASGPFWCVRAPTLRDALDDVPETFGDLGDLDTGGPTKALEFLSRGQLRQAGDHGVDYAELFCSSSTLPHVRAAGLRVPPPHEIFAEYAGWTGEKKEHRQRFRRFLRDRRPRLLAISLESDVDLTPQQLEEASSGRAKQAIRRGLAHEAIQEQMTHGRAFLLEAPTTSTLWTTAAWKDLLRRPDVGCRRMRSRLRDNLIVTNEPLLTQALFQPGEEQTTSGTFLADFSPLSPDERLQLSPSEAAAYQLRLTRDYSKAACLI